MKRVFIFGIMVMLLFGCLGTPETKPTTTGNTTIGTNLTQNTSTAGKVTTDTNCNPEYTYGTMTAATLGDSGTFTISTKCAVGKQISVAVDGTVSATKTVSSNPETLTYSLAAKKDGTIVVTVGVDGTQTHATNWTISEIGFKKTSTMDNDALSLKRWAGMQFSTSNAITVKTVKAYMKILGKVTHPDTDVIAEIRNDQNGKPGSTVLGSSTLAIGNFTVNERWISFPLATAATLSPGKYWVIMKVTTDGGDLIVDDVYWQYVSDDKTKVPNDHVMEMTLTRNSQTQTWEETTWQKLTYDRDYSYTISAN